MKPGLSWILIALSFISLMGFGFSGLLVSQSHARRVKRDARMQEAVKPFRRIRYAEMRAFTPAPRNEKSLIETTTGLFGFNLARTDQYPVPWWAVLLGALVICRLIAGFEVDVVGDIALVDVPLVWIGICRLFFGWAVTRRKTAMIRQFPDALDMIIRSIRVGIPVLGAIGTVAREAQPPTSQEFTKLGNDLAVGVPLDKAVTALADRNDLAEFRFFATAIGLQAQTGGGLSDTLESLADLIRKRIALKERGHALSSEARTSALILGSLPIVMGLGLWAMNPGYMQVLWTTSEGRMVMGAAMISLLCGAITMKVIISRSLT
jgi:tight adherence protein B